MYRVSLNKIKISPYKANLVARMVRGMSAWQAVNVLKFTNKRIAKDVCRLILSGIDSARRKNADPDALVVRELYVGKSMSLRRMRCRARGRGNVIKKQYSNIYLVLGSEGDR